MNHYMHQANDQFYEGRDNNLTIQLIWYWMKVTINNFKGETKEIWLLLQKPLYQQKNSKTNGQHKNATKTSITQRLRTD